MLLFRVHQVMNDCTLYSRKNATFMQLSHTYAADEWAGEIKTNQTGPQQRGSLTSSLPLSPPPTMTRTAVTETERILDDLK